MKSAIIVGLVVSVCVLGGLAAFLSDRIFQSQRFIDLPGTAATFETEEGWPRIGDPRDTTRQDCDAAIPCNQAVTANRVSFYRFEEKEDAARLADRLGQDAYQSNWIVIKFTDPTLTSKDRVFMQSIFDSSNTSG